MLEEVIHIKNQITVIKGEEKILNAKRRSFNQELDTIQRKCPHANKKPKHIVRKGEIVFYCPDCDADLYPK